jgi:hypothetical protein
MQTRANDMISAVSPHRQSAAEMLLHLAHIYGTVDTTLAHALVLWDRFIGSTQPNDVLNETMSRQYAIACFMISTKLRDTSHPIIGDLKEITSLCCSDLVESEQMVLSSLGWDICHDSGESRNLPKNVSDFKIIL